MQRLAVPSPDLPRQRAIFSKFRSTAFPQISPSHFSQHICSATHCRTSLVHTEHDVTMALAASQAANLAKIKALSARLTGRDSGPSPVFAAASPTTASSSFAVPARTQENHAQAAMFRPSPQAPTPAATSYSATASQTSRMTTQNNNYSLHSTSSLAPSSLRGSSVSGSSVTDSPPVKTQSDGPSLLGSADQLAVSATNVDTKLP